MADKVEKQFSRNELADYLAALAEQFRAGKLSSEKGMWTVPEKFEAKIQLKEKKGRMQFKLNWSWSTLGDYSQQDRDRVNVWHASMKTDKKRMGSSFKAVTKSAENGVFPEKKYIEDFEP